MQSCCYYLYSFVYTATLPGGPIKIEQTFSYNSGCLAVIFRLLFNAPDAQWLWNQRKRFVIVVYFKMALQRENRLKVSALLRGRPKVSEIVNLVGVCLTIDYAIKKRMDDGKGVNRRAGSVERLLWIVTACGMPFERLLWMASLKLFYTYFSSRTALSPQLWIFSCS